MDVDSLVQQAQRHILDANREQAARVAEVALTVGDLSSVQLCAIAAVLFRCRRLDEALACYERAVRVAPQDAEALRGLVFAYRAVGSIELAEQAIARVLKQKGDDYELLHLRSSLRTQKPDSNHIAALRTALATGIADWRGAVHVGYALAKELEDVGDYEESFVRLQTAATLKRSRTRYDCTADIATLELLRSRFDHETVARLKNRGYDSPEPIFVFGLPRTGSTLLERILSCHPSVDSYGELNTFPLEMVRLIEERNNGRRGSGADLVAQALELDPQVLGRRYVESAHDPGIRKPHFIDKLPMNSLNAGLIHSALPNARMILVERDPLDTCFSMYKFLFSGAYPFSYDLQETGQYYLAHRRLMEHWKTLLPRENFHCVRYERLVSNPQSETRQLLEWLQLPWDEACLRVERNAQPSLTGSATQVRQPVYRTSVGAWRHYERQLAPLRELLVAGGAYDA